MLLYIISIKDKASNSFLTPGYAHSVNMAIRDFAEKINQEGNQINRHPHDFDLYVLGLYEDKTGEIAAGDPECVAQGKHYYTGPERPATVYHDHSQNYENLMKRFTKVN